MKDVTAWRPIAPRVTVTYYGGAQYLVTTRVAPVIHVRVWQGTFGAVPDVHRSYARFGNLTGEGWYGLWHGDRDAPGFHAEQRVRRSRDHRLRHMSRPWQLLVPPPPHPDLVKSRLAAIQARYR